MSVSAASILSPAPGVEASHFAGETILLDAEGQQLRGLNVTGGRVWNLLDGSRSLAQVAEVLAGEYGVDEERVLKDVQLLAENFTVRQLVIQRFPEGEAP